MNYILRGKTPILEENILVWAQWFETANRTVVRTEMGTEVVSTIFLGIDHSFGNEIPILFETMVFGGDYDGDEKRYSTWEEAEVGHNEMVNMIKGISNAC